MNIEGKIRLVFIVHQLLGIAVSLIVAVGFPIMSQRISSGSILQGPFFDRWFPTMTFSVALMFHVIFLICFVVLTHHSLDLMRRLAPFQIANALFVMALVLTYWIISFRPGDLGCLLSHGITLDALLYALSNVLIFFIYSSGKGNSSFSSSVNVDVKKWVQITPENLDESESPSEESV